MRADLTEVAGFFAPANGLDTELLTEQSDCDLGLVGAEPGQLSQPAPQFGRVRRGSPYGTGVAVIAVGHDPGEFLRPRRHRPGEPVQRRAFREDVGEGFRIKVGNLRSGRLVAEPQ